MNFTKVKKQLKAVEKRLETQLAESKILLDSDVDTKKLDKLLIQTDKLLIKLRRNAESYEKLNCQLAELPNGESAEGRIETESDETVDFVLDISDNISDLEALKTNLELKEKRINEKETETLRLKLEKELATQKLENELKLRETIERELIQRGPTITAGNGQIPQHITSVKLPKLEISKFDGNILKWQEFWDSFESAVHSNNSLHSVDKLNYLKSQLSGDVKIILSGLELTNENYEVAISLLKERYGRKQTLINAHYSKLSDLAVATQQTSKLRWVVDTLEKHLRSLAALGEDVNHNYFVSLIMSKLPPEIILKLEESKETDQWTVKILRDKIQKIILAREVAEYTVKPTPISNYDESSCSRKFTNRSTTLFTTSDRALPKRQEKKCFYCDQKNHWSDECRTFSSLYDRKNKIKGSCFICLKLGHRLHDCLSNKSCFHCGQRKNHHRSLCPKMFPDTRSENPITAVESDPICSENSLLAIGERVLLQTATSSLKNCANNLEVSTKLILDCGSQRSYITKRLAQQLKLQSKGHDVLSISTFGSSTPKVIKCPIVQLELKLIDNSQMKLKANVVPQITGNIQQSSVDLIRQNYLCKQLPLADKDILSGNCHNAMIDLLIGNDYYWDLVTSEKLEINPGLYLIGSKLGWIANGRVKDNAKDTYSHNFLTHSKHLASENCSFLPSEQTQSNELYIKDWWDIETIGIKEQSKENDYDKSLRNFNDTVRFTDNRDLVTWPRKETDPESLDNYQLARSIEDQHNKGIVEPVLNDDNTDWKRHNIPHHSVINVDKHTNWLHGPEWLQSLEENSSQWNPPPYDEKGKRHLNSFWNVWRDEYLQILRERTQTHLREPRKLSRNKPKVGDVVTIKEDLPRGSWRIACIVELIKGHGGCIRSVKVKLPKGRTLNRALCHLYPIECDEVQQPDQPNSNENENVTEEPTFDPKGTFDLRPARKSSIEARQKIQKCLNSFVGLGSVAECEL